MRRAGTRGRAIAVVALLAIMIGTLAASPANAESTSQRPGRQTATFDLTGSLCPAEGPTPAEGRSHRQTIDLAGATEATIGLMTGQLSARVGLGRAEGARPSGFGRWELEPETSTGSLQGWVFVDRRGRASLVGRGEGALAGTIVRARIDVVVNPNCSNGWSLVGSGRTTRRQPAAPVGAVQVTGTKPVAVAVADLTAAVEANPNLTLVGTVDHQAAAASRGLALGPTVELFFGNPNLGTPLMVSAQSTGIDLPQKILIWEDLFGSTRIAYNAPTYLQSRHGISGADAQLGVIGNALAALAGVAAGAEVPPTFDAGQVTAGAGLRSIESDRPADEAFASIVAALEAASPVNVAIVLEHDANATRVGLELDPTKLVVFGNPSLGTGLMQTTRSIALDLPQKILVSQSGEGPTVISWNDPHWVGERHGLTGQDDVLDTLAGALANFAAQGQ